jgi:cyclopropane-fatty-acyl-phospholipid synthase
MMSPGELGFARAFVSGDIEIEGDIYDALDARYAFDGVVMTPAMIKMMASQAIPVITAEKRQIPDEEIRPRGKRHGLRRDKEAVSSHYDASNTFYSYVLGPSMTYTCSIRETEKSTLEDAQAYKCNLVCKKLGLQPGMTLLDIGCGWGTLAITAAKNYGAKVVGVTLSQEQASFAQNAVKEAGLDDLVDIRIQDYREITNEKFDAISSVGMYEHVGRAQVETYFDTCFSLLNENGRFLNHAISIPGITNGKVAKAFSEVLHKIKAERVGAPFGLPALHMPIRGSFIDRYVFPDSELHEIGNTISWMQEAGFEARHMESIREHYAFTLRQWVKNLQANWDACVNEVGVQRARVWLLYMAGVAQAFEKNNIQVHQVLAVKHPTGDSGMPLRPDWE